MRIELTDIINKFPRRKQNSHKGTYGKILNIAGSKFYSGAAILSSLSALKVGGGYVTLGCPDTIIDIVASYTPDLTFMPLTSTEVGTIAKENTEKLFNKINEYDVLSIGSGLSINGETSVFFEQIISKINIPVIIDADGLNIISAKNIINLPKNSILTPHPKELSRLLNISVEEIQNRREYYANFASKKYNAVVVLKGHNTIVAYEDNVYINQTGNSALSKAGSGDVLTGIISGILAQKEDKNLFESACLGVYIHGLAGELAALDMSEYGVLASDIIKYISNAIMELN